MKAKQKSFISSNNSKNLNIRPNSSNRSKISQRQLIRIKNSFSELYPPITLTMPKTRKASHMGNLITKEELYEENMQLKNIIKKLKKELEDARTNLFKKGLELDEKEKIINDCNKVNVTEKEHEINLNKAKENSLLSKCKKSYMKMKLNFEEACKENELLKMNIKLTNLKEYQIQIDTYKKEMEKLRKLYLNTKENNLKVFEELNGLKEIKNEYMNQHSLINTITKKCQDLNDEINKLKEENNMLKNEIEKNQRMQKRLRQKNIKLKISNDKYMKMKKMQEGSLMNNKDHINKLNNLEKDLANYKDLYEKQNYEYNRILNNRNKQNSNIINPDLIKGVNFLKSKVIEKRIENNQEELYKSLFKEEKIKNNILMKYLKENGIDTQKILKENGYDGIIHREQIIKHQSSNNFTDLNNSQNTKCATSKENKENNFERSKNLNRTQSNLDFKYNNHLNTEESKSNINNRQSFSQEQFKEKTEEMADSQNSDFYRQESFKKDNQFFTLSHVFMKNLEARHITKDIFINKIKEISKSFENKDKITKEDFLKPFVNLFIDLMKVTDDKDIVIIQEFLSNLIDETEGDCNKFFYELIDITHNIIDYTLIENEEDVLNLFAYELMPHKEKLKSLLGKFDNNLITFDSLRNIFDELKIKFNNEYYQYLLFKMKENAPEKSSIFSLNYQFILDILEREIILNSNNDIQNLSDNTNKDENRINEEDNESEDNKINLQISLIFKELKQALINNKTNFEEECKSIIQNLDFDNKKINLIDKEEFFNILQKYKIEVEENIKQVIFMMFKLENNALEISQNDITLMDYDKILSFLKN